MAISGAMRENVEKNCFGTVKSRSDRRSTQRAYNDLKRLKAGIQTNTISVLKVVICRNPDEHGAQTNFKEGTKGTKKITRRVLLIP